ncbi:hypothetical protein VE03_10787 [Pseudogymnoascus sp. 23342-1-I1]|nr:hypothetical protein VE03_10787 [Pseudogymnoascus sp. 23342-1-I1]
MASQHIGADSLELALETLIDPLRNNSENYDKVCQADKDKAEPFTSWCLRKIDTELIITVSQLVHGAHLKLFSAPKLAALCTLANAFQTKEWMIYFILGENTIGTSVKVKASLP